MDQLKVRTKANYDNDVLNIFGLILGSIVSLMGFILLASKGSGWAVYAVLLLISTFVFLFSFVFRCDYVDKISEEDRFHLKLYLDTFPELKQDIAAMLQKGFVVRIEFDSVREYIKSKREYNFAYSILQEENQQ